MFWILLLWSSQVKRLLTFSQSVSRNESIYSSSCLGLKHLIECVFGCGIMYVLSKRSSILTWKILSQFNGLFRIVLGLFIFCCFLRILVYILFPFWFLCKCKRLDNTQLKLLYMENVLYFVRFLLYRLRIYDTNLTIIKYIHNTFFKTTYPLIIALELKTAFCWKCNLTIRLIQIFSRPKFVSSVNINLRKLYRCKTLTQHF